jgi:DNA-binding transcriptional LysR family regulator
MERMTSSATIRQYRHFVSLAETRSFTRAAEECHISQSALSRSIAALESDLGVGLIDRIGKTVELTDVGLAVLDHARHVVVDVDELTRCVSIHAQGETGQFRLGLGATPAALVAEALLIYVANRYPRLRLTLLRGPVEEQLDSLRARKLDAIVVDLRAVLAAPDLSIDHLAQMSSVLMCRRDHPLARADRKIEFEDLLSFPVASTQWSDELARFIVSTYGSRAHPDQLINLRCEDVSTLLNVALGSNALLFSVHAIGREFIERGELVTLNFRTQGLGAKFGLVRLAGRSMPPFYSQFRTFVAERISSK